MELWVIDDEWADYDVETALLRDRFPGCQIHFSGRDYRQDLPRYGPLADGILCQISMKLDRTFLDGLNKCRVISVYGSGYDNIDLAAATERRIRVTNVPGYCAVDVADYVIAALFYEYKLRFAYTGEGWGAAALAAPARRLAGRTLFIVGLGRIGCLVAQKALALGLEVLYYDVCPPAQEPPGIRRAELEEGLSLADFVTLHANLTENTRYLIDARRLALMKPTAWLINAARGGLVDEAALVSAVKTGRLGGAVLDVIGSEPPAGQEPILHCPNIYVTPHISYYSIDSIAELKRRTAQNAADVLDGRVIPETVNF